MQTILENISSPLLISAVERNLQELGILWGYALGAEFHQQSEATWFVSGVPFFLLNWVTHTQFTSETPQATIDNILTHLSEYKLPLFWIVNSSSSNDFISDIKARGWKGGPTSVWAGD